MLPTTCYLILTVCAQPSIFSGLCQLLFKCHGPLGLSSGDSDAEDVQSGPDVRVLDRFRDKGQDPHLSWQLERSL